MKNIFSARSMTGGAISVMWVCLAALITAALTGTAAAASHVQSGQPADAADAGYRDSIEHWRTERRHRLAQADGWLTVVGLDWLQAGENQVGNAPDNDIRLPAGPAHWGTVIVHNGTLRFVNLGGDQVTINGKSLQRSMLVADTQGEPTIVASGTLSFYAIVRESFALRVKDSNAPARLGFKGIDNYPLDPSWRINGRFKPAADGSTIEIANVLGQVSDTPVSGIFEFERGGRTHRLLAIEENAADVWFIFTDRTSGHGTYGAGRFLHSDGLPVNGRLTVDFNKAYNPPCAFTDFATCPLPPQQNRMSLSVTAGEMDYHSQHPGGQ